MHLNCHEYILHKIQVIENEHNQKGNVYNSILF